MIKINDYATKNHLNDWEIKELPEGDYRLDLTGGDLTLLYLSIIKIEECHLFCPVLPNYHNSIYAQINHILHARGIVLHTLESSNTFNATGSSLNLNQVFIQNITPDWSKYIAKDNAVLFLSETDARKYKNIQQNIYVLSNDGTICNLLDKEGIIPSQNRSVILHHFRKISIILPSIHSKNIQEIRNIAKDLKENYGVEYVEVIATHCFIRYFWDKVEILKTKEEIRNEAIKKVKNNLNLNLAIDIINGDKSDFILAVRQSNTSAEEIFDLIAKAQPEVLERHIVDKIELIDKFKTVKDIDKLITTDSTGIHKVRDTEHLQIIDCQEFFNK